MLTKDQAADFMLLVAMEQSFEPNYIILNMPDELLTHTLVTIS